MSHRHDTKRIPIENQRWDPVTSISSAVLGMATEMVDHTAGILLKPYEEYKRGKPSAPTSPTSDSAGPPKNDDKGEGSSRGVLASASAESRSGLRTAGAMATASGMSASRVVTSSVKGVVVDIPLAVTEGFYRFPKLYGEDVRDHGQIKDWKSGAVVAGKTFAYGMSEGLTDLFVQPYKGGKEEGVLGVAKGLGKGPIGLTTKTISAVCGLVTYPTQGIYQSIRSLAHEKTRKNIIKSRHEEGEWLVREERGLQHSYVSEAYVKLVAMR